MPAVQGLCWEKVEETLEVGKARCKRKWILSFMWWDLLKDVKQRNRNNHVYISKIPEHGDR